MCYCEWTIVLNPHRLDGIDVFVKVVQCGSFSGAARLLGMPVTTVSGKVAALERRLGVTLIHRTTRKLSITQAGEVYFAHCVRALEEVSAAEKSLFSAKAEPEGLLRVTAPPDIGHLILPPIVREYLKSYPKTQIELILTNRIVDLVGEGVDLGIRAARLKDSTYVAKKFLDLEIALYASAAYVKKNGLPRHPKELSKHSFIAFRPFTDTLKFVNQKGERFKASLKPRITVDDIEAVKLFIASGDGIGVSSPFICEPEIVSGKFIKLLPNWNLDLNFGPKSRLWFVYPPQKYVAPKIQAFIEVAMRSCRK